MRLVGIIVGAALGMAVIAEGAYIVRTRSQVAALSQRLANLGAFEDEGRRSPPSVGSGRSIRDEEGEVDDEPAPGPGREGPAARPPRFVAPGPAAGAPATADDPLPLPAAITSPEAREQLRQFILAQLERERQEARARNDERRDQRTRERNEKVAKDLGLSPAENEKFLKIVAQADAARASLRDRIEAGQVDRGAIRQETMALRSENDKQLRALLGDDRLAKFDEIRRSQGGPPEGLWGGRGPRGGGPGGPPEASPNQR